MDEKRKISLVLAEIWRLRTLCLECGLHPVIEVDGGEKVKTAAQAAAAGATDGPAIFGTKDHKGAIAALRASAAAAVGS